MMNQSLQSRRGGLLAVNVDAARESGVQLLTLVGLGSKVLAGMVRNHIHIPPAVSSAVAPYTHFDFATAVVLVWLPSAIHLRPEQERRRFPLV